MGFSLADTAEYLGVSKSTVQTSFNRGIRKLQQRSVWLEQNRGVTPLSRRLQARNNRPPRLCLAFQTVSVTVLQHSGPKATVLKLLNAGEG